MWGASANPDSSRANSRRTRPASPTPTSLADSVEANAVHRARCLVRDRHGDDIGRTPLGQLKSPRLRVAPTGRHGSDRLLPPRSTTRRTRLAPTSHGSNAAPAEVGIAAPRSRSSARGPARRCGVLRYSATRPRTGRAHRGAMAAGSTVAAPSCASFSPAAASERLHQADLVARTPGAAAPSAARPRMPPCSDQTRRPIREMLPGTSLDAA